MAWIKSGDKIVFILDEAAMNPKGDDDNLNVIRDICDIRGISINCSIGDIGRVHYIRDARGIRLYAGIQCDIGGVARIGSV